MIEPYTFRGSARSTPVVAEVPHCGIFVPVALQQPIRADARAHKTDADLYIDRMWQAAPEHGAPLLCATVSRYVCDLNRDPNDVDGAAVADHANPRVEAPRGFVWRVATDGQPILSRPLTNEEWQMRVEQVWRPYHSKVESLLTDAVSKHGYAMLVSGHSMPSVGRTEHSDSGRARADIVLGWRGGDACSRRLLDQCQNHFHHRNYSVAVDNPYRGGNTTARYGRPKEGLHAIQIEVSRALYMDEAKLLLDEPSMARLRDDANTLLDKLASFDPRE